MLPTLVVHADWGINPAKRWSARALLVDGAYRVAATTPVRSTTDMLARLLHDAGRGGSVLAGFDFPIGLPAAYAERAGIGAFLEVLGAFGGPEWADFYKVAERPDEIDLRRPFYPQRPGGSLHQHLVDALGVERMDALRRVCDRGHAKRRAASPMFWTLGGQQVGKAAIAGWRDVLAPAMRDPNVDVAVWPFSGPLDWVIAPDRVAVAETYPGEFYHHLGITWPRSAAGTTSGKRVQRDRAANAAALESWADRVGVSFDPALVGEVRNGFGAAADGEDRFDAVVGLCGMLNVVLGHRPPGDPTDDDRIWRVEGWMLGQASSNRPVD